MSILYYDSNNSGGGWWLTDENWKTLESRGWTVHWVTPRTNEDPFGGLREYEFERLLTPRPFTNERWLGALAMSAAKAFDTKKEGIHEWSEITGENPKDLGCGCCGNPHNFKWYRSAEDYDYISPEYPTEAPLRGMEED